MLLGRWASAQARRRAGRPVEPLMSWAAVLASEPRAFLASDSSAKRVRKVKVTRVKKRSAPATSKAAALSQDDLDSIADVLGFAPSQPAAKGRADEAEASVPPPNEPSRPDAVDHDVDPPGMEPYEPQVSDLSDALPNGDQGVALTAIRALYTYAEGMDAALAEHAMDSNLWARCVARLRGEVLNRPKLAFGEDLDVCKDFLRRCARFAHSGDAAYLAPLSRFVVSTGERHFRPILEAAKVLRQTADLRNPASWYPEARLMPRKIVLHTGPTNSGKTYQALKSLQAAGSGVYCGPLRLLALEVYESMNQEGAITNLVTGQERRELMFATHTSCTVEMTNLEKEYDVGVIDEIQMVGDDQRGWAWTRAFLGMRAKEIHVCGDPAAAGVVRKLAGACGDELEERVYDRLTPLRVSNRSLGGSLRNVKKGDAVVAFRRRDIYQIRRLIERMTGHKCCVVYGRLPPETRNAQARLFNDERSGYDVLVASDAIGMGLNLNIRRVVFSEVTKFNGIETVILSPSQLKQIAGRAGRAGGRYPEGTVTAFDDEDLDVVQDGLAAPSEVVQAAGLQPNTDQVVQFADSWRRMHGSVPALSRLLSNFTKASQLDGDYFMCDAKGTVEIAEAIEGIPGLTLAQQHDLTAAPVRLRDPDVRACFVRYAEALASNTPIGVDVQLPITSRASPRHLDVLEGRMQAIELYCWLANRFPLVFTEMEAAEELRARGLAAIEEGLTELTKTASEETMKQSAQRRSQHARRRGGRGGAEGHRGRGRGRGRNRDSSNGAGGRSDKGRAMASEGEQERA